MGIQGLLKFLKDATTEIHIREYAGRCVAVDTYCWLHRGAFACADKLAKGEKTDQYVKYCMKFIDMLESYNVRPILVFDGCHLPSKKEVEKQRRERRELYMQKGKQFLREGKVNEARDAFTKCISVTPQMAHHVMEVARERGIDCIVAPYEADSQLAFLLKHGYAQAVVTEDSDLLCFGSSKVILKMDLTGRAQEVSLDNLDKVKNLAGFTIDTFRHACILSGCDYLASIKGIGLVKACKALKLAKNKDVFQTVKRLHQYIKAIPPVEPSYAVGFEKAEKTFLYQLVLDPKTRKLTPLNSYPADIRQEDMPYAGPLMPDDKALQIAWGNTCVNTGRRFGHFDADVWLKSKHWNGKKIMVRSSIWENDFLSKAKINKDKNDVAGKSTNHSSLRGKEKILNMKNFQFSTKKKQTAEFLSQDEASENCTRKEENTKEEEKKSEKKSKVEMKADSADDLSEILNKYKDAKIPEKFSLKKKLSLRKRMRTSSPAMPDDQICIVKSRFFAAKDNSASFMEESEDLDVTHVEETPENSNCSTTLNKSSLADDTDLNNILDEIATDSGKEQKRKSSTRITPMKRKNPFSASKTKDSSHLSEKNKTTHNTPACLKKFKRKIIKPPRLQINDQNSDEGEEDKEESSIEKDPVDVPTPEKLSSMEDMTCAQESTSKDGEETIRIDDESNSRSPKQEANFPIDLDVSAISTEEIPILDEAHKKSISCNILSEKSEICDISSENILPDKFDESLKKPSVFSYKDFMTNVKVTDENGKHRNSNDNKISIYDKVDDPIVLSSDDENIPYVDDIVERPSKRQKTLGLHRKTSPVMSAGVVKSKYFGEAKASGLRKKMASSSLKKKTSKSNDIAKNQPKITSLFTKSTKSKRKVLSPSKDENVIDFTPESPEDSDLSKIKAKMLTTRKLFESKVR